MKIYVFQILILSLILVFINLCKEKSTVEEKPVNVEQSPKPVNQNSVPENTTENNQEVKKSSKMIVASKSGLTLREEPSKTSEKIALLPFLTPVQIQEETEVKETIDGKEDVWVHVSATISSSSHSGYVFRGFLSPSVPEGAPKESFFINGECEDAPLPEDTQLCLGYCISLEINKELVDSSKQSLVFFVGGKMRCFGYERFDGQSISHYIEKRCSYELIDYKTILIKSPEGTHKLFFKNNKFVLEAPKTGVFQEIDESKPCYKVAR